MLTERSVADVSLRELSETVGLAKSNMLRYFDSREAIFLELLDEQWALWLDDLEPALRDLAATPLESPWAREGAVARAIAETLFGRPLLCELISAMAGVLERNIGVEFARQFKSSSAFHNARFEGLLRHALPELTPAAVAKFRSVLWVITAGLWPYAHPTEGIHTVTAEMGVTIRGLTSSTSSPTDSPLSWPESRLGSKFEAARHAVPDA